MNIEFIEKDQVWQNETTRYWFDVDGVTYCIADNNGDLKLLDSEGFPIDDCNDFGSIKEKLTPLYLEHVLD